MGTLLCRKTNHSSDENDTPKLRIIIVKMNGSYRVSSIFTGKMSWLVPDHERASHQVESVFGKSEKKFSRQQMQTVKNVNRILQMSGYMRKCFYPIGEQ